MTEEKSSSNIHQARYSLIQAMAPAPIKSAATEASNVRFFASSCPLPPWQFELSRIYRVASQDSSACLLQYLYHPRPDWDIEVAALKLAWYQFESAQGPFSPSKHKSLSALCYLALQNYRHEVMRGKPAHKVSRLIEISGVSASNWRRDWLPLWRQLNLEIKQLDHAALARLSYQLKD